MPSKEQLHDEKKQVLKNLDHAFTQLHDFVNRTIVTDKDRKYFWQIMEQIVNGTDKDHELMRQLEVSYLLDSLKSLTKFIEENHARPNQA